MTLDDSGCGANASTVRHFSKNNFNYANPSLGTKPVGLHLYKGKGTLVNYHCLIHASRPSQCCQLPKVRSQTGANHTVSLCRPKKLRQILA
jgi:hypothetical protein